MQTARTGAAKPSVWYDPAVRGVVYQALLVIVVAFVFYEAFSNGRANMRARNIPTDFAFWNSTSGFDVSQSLISYSAVSTYGRAFYLGLLNTLLVSAIGLVFATLIGFIVGIARLSSNWIVARLATVYVETLRNIPLLLQLLFWYNAILRPLPGPRQSIAIPGDLYLNNRGLFMPAPVLTDGAEWIGVAFLVAVAAAIGWRYWAHARQMKTGRAQPVALVALLLVVGLPLLVYFLAGRPIGLDVPQLKGFNFNGGWRLIPEFVTLVFGLSLYTATFIAEIVRAGVLAVPNGQSEAAAALGLQRGQGLRHIVVPQAMRIIIPPLTSQYLNLIKNSSLAVFIGYPDLVQVFAGTVLNQTGAAVQVISITMLVYLAISLVTSYAMNVFNSRMSLVER